MDTHRPSDVTEREHWRVGDRVRVRVEPSMCESHVFEFVRDADRVYGVQVVVDVDGGSGGEMQEQMVRLERALQANNGDITITDDCIDNGDDYGDDYGDDIVDVSTAGTSVQAWPTMPQAWRHHLTYGVSRCERLKSDAEMEKNVGVSDGGSP